MKINMDIKMSPTKLEASDEIEVLRSVTDAKLNTNDLAIRSGSNLRVIAIKDDTYDNLRTFAGPSRTYDDVLRKCLQAYKKKEKRASPS